MVRAKSFCVLCFAVIIWHLSDNEKGIPPHQTKQHFNYINIRPRRQNLDEVVRDNKVCSLKLDSEKKMIITRIIVLELFL